MASPQALCPDPTAFPQAPMLPRYPKAAPHSPGPPFPHALPDPLAVQGGVSPPHRAWPGLGSCHAWRVPPWDPWMCGGGTKASSPYSSPANQAAPASPRVPGGRCFCCYLWPPLKVPGSRDPVPPPGSPWPEVPKPRPCCWVPIRGLYLGRPHGGAKSGLGLELPANARLQRALPALGAVTVGSGDLPTPFPFLAPTPYTPAPFPGQHPFPMLF